MNATLTGHITEAVIEPEQTTRLLRLVEGLLDTHGSADDPRLLRRAASLGDELPTAVHDALLDLRYETSTAGLVVRGGPVGEPPTPTPRHWRERTADATARHDIWLVLLAAQLGDLVCWSTLQNGRLLGDVMPIRGEEDQQTGHSSETELDFHVEDAFHDDRCDNLALLTLRNDDAVATTIASTASLRLSELDLRTLFAPRFRIQPDSEHLRHTPDKPVTDQVTAVLYGDPAAPYLRVDPAFTEPLPGDDTALAAYTALCVQLAANLVDVHVPAGDVLLIDNHRAVHGRRPFRPRYDGRDRWLRKATVVRDLQRRRNRRKGPDPRVWAPF